MSAEAWAVVEIMGHTRIAGKVREVTRAGIPMLEVEVPEMDGRPGYVRRYAGAAIFSETPVSEALAIEFLRRNSWSIPNPLMLAAAPAETPPDAEVEESCVGCGKPTTKRNEEGDPLCDACFHDSTAEDSDPVENDDPGEPIG